jgi:hypothetical protein
MFGHSIPLAGPAGFVAGLVVGEIAGRVAKEAGADEKAEALARKVAHFGASSLTGWAINALTFDPTGAAAQPLAAWAGAEAHQALLGAAFTPAFQPVVP